MAACEHYGTCIRAEHLGLGQRRRVASITDAAAGGRTATVEAVAEAHFTHPESARRSAGTLRRYRQLWRQWLAPDLAQVQPAVLTRASIERTLGDMADAGQSQSSTHQAAIVLSGCLACAHCTASTSSTVCGPTTILPRMRPCLLPSRPNTPLATASVECVKAVLDPNVIISALLLPGGSPAKVFRAWIDGSYELITSELMLGELERALSYPKLRKRIEAQEAAELVELLRREAELIDDPDSTPAVLSPDPGDNYLVALAPAARAVIVSGDLHLLGLAEQLPIYSPADFLAQLDSETRRSPSLIGVRRSEQARRARQG